MTAPTQSPNVEYDVIDDPEVVFCEDEQKELPEADCRQIREAWYSIKFLQNMKETIEEIEGDVQYLARLTDKFLRDGDFSLKVISMRASSVRFEITCLLDMFQKIDISPEKKK